MKDKAYIDGLLRKLADIKGGSDIIITNKKTAQYRVNNELVSADDDVLTSEDTMNICKSLLRDDQYERFQNEQEFDFSYFIEGLARFRVNLYFQRGNAAMVASISSTVALRWGLTLLPAASCSANSRRTRCLSNDPVVGHSEITAPLGCFAKKRGTACRFDNQSLGATSRGPSDPRGSGGVGASCCINLSASRRTWRRP